MTEPTLLLLPPKIWFETPEVLKKLIAAHRYLAELKGIVMAIPNQVLLINALTLTGIRKLHGTELQNHQTGKTIYKPPQDHQEILNLITNLAEFINNDDLYDTDDLIKMAIIHLQFEWIHPFYDGNRRTGRTIKCTLT